MNDFDIVNGRFYKYWTEEDEVCGWCGKVAHVSCPISMLKRECEDCHKTHDIAHSYPFALAVLNQENSS